MKTIPSTSWSNYRSSFRNIIGSKKYIVTIVAAVLDKSAVDSFGEGPWMRVDEPPFPKAPPQPIVEVKAVGWKYDDEMPTREEIRPLITV